MGLKHLNSPCPLLKNSTALAFCVKCPANQWMKRMILQFFSNENDFWEGCRLRAMLPSQYYQYMWFLFSLILKGGVMTSELWLCGDIIWADLLNSPALIWMCWIHSALLRRVLDRDWCLQKAEKLQIKCFDAAPRVSLACFPCYYWWSFFCIHSCTTCSHSSQF